MSTYTAISNVTVTATISSLVLNVNVSKSVIAACDSGTRMKCILAAIAPAGQPATQGLHPITNTIHILHAASGKRLKSFSLMNRNIHNKC